MRRCRRIQKTVVHTNRTHIAHVQPNLTVDCTSSGNGGKSPTSFWELPTAGKVTHLAEKIDLDPDHSTTGMNEVSEQVIDSLYDVFRPYQLGSDFDGCDHCVDPVATKRLARIDLRNLSMEDLSRYSQKAITTWGDDRHFRYFLPRLFELVLEDPRHESLHIEVLFGKLAYANWYQWHQREREAIGSYFELLWKSVLSQPALFQDDDIADSVLCAFGAARADLDAFLSYWTTTNENAARTHFNEFVVLNASYLRDKDRLWNTFWENDSKESTTVKEWLSSDSLRTLILSREACADERGLEAILAIQTL